MRIRGREEGMAGGWERRREGGRNRGMYICTCMVSFRRGTRNPLSTTKHHLQHFTHSGSPYNSYM